jgi:hypothetical protein
MPNGRSSISVAVRTYDLIQMARRQVQATEPMLIEPVTVESPQFRPILSDLRHFRTIALIGALVDC